MTETDERKATKGCSYLFAYRSINTEYELACTTAIGMLSDTVAVQFLQATLPA